MVGGGDNRYGFSILSLNCVDPKRVEDSALSLHNEPEYEYHLWFSHLVMEKGRRKIFVRAFDYRHLVYHTHHTCCTVRTFSRRESVLVNLTPIGVEVNHSCVGGEFLCVTCTTQKDKRGRRF
jgi:hypothetical protein